MADDHLAVPEQFMDDAEDLVDQVSLAEDWPLVYDWANYGERASSDAWAMTAEQAEALVIAAAPNAVKEKLLWVYTQGTGDMGILCHGLGFQYRAVQGRFLVCGRGEADSVGKAQQKRYGTYLYYSRPGKALDYINGSDWGSGGELWIAAFEGRASERLDADLETVEMQFDER